MAGKTKPGMLALLGRMLKIYAKMDLLWFLRDTRFCLLQIATDCVVSLASVTGMFLLAARFEGFGGFTRPELLFMLGCSLLVNGIYSIVFINNNAGHISRVIGRGQLDHALVQPVPLILHFMVQGVGPVSGSGPFLCGVALTVYAMVQLHFSISAGWLCLLVLLLLLAFVILTSWVYGVSTLAFWAPYAAEEIAPEVTSMFSTLGPYPLGGLGKLAQFLLCTALPIGAMAWLPSQILLGKTQAGPAIALLSGTAAVSLVIALLLFRKGLGYYAKHSSPRYTGFGR